jgi:release factor glutamine methyltransferase
MFSDIAPLTGGRKICKALVEAYEAAWAQSQGDQPGFPKTDEEKTFQRVLIDWHLFHESMLIGEAIPYLVRYLNDNPAAVLADEYQDLNKAEQTAIAYLSEKAHICIVGDDDQSIYSFKNAHPRASGNGRTSIRCAEFNMLECLRCPTTVVEMANSLISNNRQRQGRLLKPIGANGRGEVQIVQLGTERQGRYPGVRIFPTRMAIASGALRDDLNPSAIRFGLADETPAISYCASETNSEIARLARYDMRTTYEDISALDRATLPPSRSKQLLRTAIHLLSYHFILTRRRTTVARVAGFRLSVRPTVFHPRYFLSSKFFANFLADIDLAGKRVADVGTGSGILALAAARAGAASVVALDINPNAAKAAAENAHANGLSKPIMVVGSNLLSALAPRPLFDVILSSPPSFAGEPRDVADRAWHAGPNYRDIAMLFNQARKRLAFGGCMYVLFSTDSDLDLLGNLIRRAGFAARLVAEQSIFIESLIIYELRVR